MSRNLAGTVAPIIVALASLLSTEAQGDVIYMVTANTSSPTSIQGTQGYIDFQFNAGSSGSQSAVAKVSGFSSDGTLSSASSDGSGSGDLSVPPNILTITNNPNNALNDVLQGFTFGTTLSFLVDFSGPALTSPGTDGSAFSVTFYDSGFNTLLSTASSGAVATIAINADTSFSTTTSSTDAISITPYGAPVPEPASIVLLVAGALGVRAAGGRRRRRGA